VSPTLRLRPARVRAPTDVNSRQLRAAVAVAQYRSFIAAAADLGISQPALTLSIKRLEATLGVELFLRNTRARPRSSEPRKASMRKTENFSIWSV
jgi:Bacterial regulatory helix-turn-helix protein, lysR family